MSTRDKLLAIGLEQFAERGFDGVSIANIADELGLSKQALLHHFSSKEKLYAEVLASISREFEDRVTSLDRGANDAESLADLLLALHEDSLAHPRQTALLMRELLDNSQRAQKAERWFLRDFLKGIIERVHALENWRDAPESAAAATAYQLLGAVNYFAVSTATLRAVLGRGSYAAMASTFADQLRALTIATLAAGPASESPKSRAR